MTLSEIVLNLGAGAASLMMVAFVLYGAAVLGSSVGSLIWEIAAFVVVELRKLRSAR
jgi:hypothetical protein